MPESKKGDEVIKLTGLNKEEVVNISKQIADAFYNYKYNEDDLGLVKYIKSKEDMFLMRLIKEWHYLHSIDLKDLSFL